MAVANEPKAPPSVRPRMQEQAEMQIALPEQKALLKRIDAIGKQVPQGVVIPPHLMAAAVANEKTAELIIKVAQMGAQNPPEPPGMLRRVGSKVWNVVSSIAVSVPTAVVGMYVALKGIQNIPLLDRETGFGFNQEGTAANKDPSGFIWNRAKNSGMIIGAVGAVASTIGQSISKSGPQAEYETMLQIHREMFTAPAAKQLYERCLQNKGGCDPQMTQTLGHLSHNVAHLGGNPSDGMQMGAN